LISFETHIGKKDHNCFQMTYDAMCHFPRRWTPMDVWGSLTSGGNATNMFPSTRRHLSSTKLHEDVNSSYDVLERQRREKILSILFYLKRKGAIKAGLQRLKCVSSSHSMKAPGGSGPYPYYIPSMPYMFITEFVNPAITRLFPAADTGQWNHFSQQSLMVWNIDQMAYLLNLESLVELVSHRGDNPSMSMSVRRNLIIFIIWELCELVADSITPTWPYPNRFAGPEQILAQYVLESFAAELVLSKVMECVSRVEPVWQLHRGKVGKSFVDPNTLQPGVSTCAENASNYDVETRSRSLSLPNQGTSSKGRETHPKSLIMIWLDRIGGPKLDIDSRAFKDHTGALCFQYTIGLLGIHHEGSPCTTKNEAERSAFEAVIKNVLEHGDTYKSKGLNVQELYSTR